MTDKININKMNELDNIRGTRKTSIQSAEIERKNPLENKVENQKSQDKLQLSGQATEIYKLLEDIKQLPEIREAKVEELRRQIETGQYNPSSEDIASAILKENEF